MAPTGHCQPSGISRQLNLVTTSGDGIYETGPDGMYETSSILTKTFRLGSRWAGGGFSL